MLPYTKYRTIKTVKRCRSCSSERRLEDASTVIVFFGGLRLRGARLRCVRSWEEKSLRIFCIELVEEIRGSLFMLECGLLVDVKTGTLKACADRNKVAVDEIWKSESLG